ncbi:hypothetical protein RW1_041_00900 [Rhodococcus wratislaviensis NBRC 100605]|uniref:Uncharacterized protein n=1 Tax=Rhodococcus wratislaviensis NBRC 100605 TaxID=1219028 RepID=X0Q9G3_RHOWR|nr:hypothetical protein RW1_041_00900 [Rhodococcus wratislaviensis NBRC 100605]
MFSDTVLADPFLIVGEAVAVVDQEATGTGEFVRLFRDDADGEFFAGQGGAGQLERLCVSVSVSVVSTEPEN